MSPVPKVPIVSYHSQVNCLQRVQHSRQSRKNGELSKADEIVHLCLKFLNKKQTKETTLVPNSINRYSQSQPVHSCSKGIGSFFYLTLKYLTKIFPRISHLISASLFFQFFWIKQTIMVANQTYHWNEALSIWKTWYRPLSDILALILGASLLFQTVWCISIAILLDSDLFMLPSGNTLRNHRTVVDFCSFAGPPHLSALLPIYPNQLMSKVYPQHLGREGVPLPWLISIWRHRSFLILMTWDVQI